MEILKRLDHVNIVKALNIPAGLDPMSVGDTPCICMEYCDGGDLRQVSWGRVSYGVEVHCSRTCKTKFACV